MNSRDTRFLPFEIGAREFSIEYLQRILTLILVLVADFLFMGLWLLFENALKISSNYFSSLHLHFSALTEAGLFLVGLGILLIGILIALYYFQNQEEELLPLLPITMVLIGIFMAIYDPVSHWLYKHPSLSIFFVSVLISIAFYLSLIKALKKRMEKLVIKEVMRDYIYKNASNFREKEDIILLKNLSDKHLDFFIQEYIRLIIENSTKNDRKNKF